MQSVDVRAQKLSGWFAKLSFTSLLIAVIVAAPFRAALAQVAPSLGTAQSFAVLGGSTVTNTGPTIVSGNLGVSPGTAVTGFPPGTVIGGTIHAADALALQAQSDTTAAYLNLAGQACGTTYGAPTDLGGLTLVPGVYCFLSSAQLTGVLTLDALGDPNAAWVFEIASTLITASNSSVLLVNGAEQCNDFWQVGSSATLGTGTKFIGNILALTSISLTTNATVSGRTLAQNGAVTMDSNTVSFAACSVPPVTPVPPTLGKAFSPATIAAGGVSTLTITLNNPDSSVANLTAPLIDTLPTGVVVSGNASNTCGGTVAATAGGSTVTLTGGSIPANSSCTVTVDVTAASGGNYINSLAAGVLHTSNGDNAAPAVATLTVTTPTDVLPTLGKAFSPATIKAGGVSTITITLSNPSATVANLTAPLMDTLPSGLVVSGNASNTCGGTVAATAGGSTVTLTGGSIPANGSCTVTVDVTAPSGGNYINSLAAGSLQTSNGDNAAPAVSTLTVNNPASITPTLGKAFSPATITAGGVSNLTITLNNANSTVANLTAPLIDTLPSGLLVSGSASTTCGGSVAASIGGSTVTLTGGSIPANGSCTVSVQVTAKDKGSYTNTIPAGALQTSKGNNSTSAVAILTVNPVADNAPSLSKTFSPATITAGGVSILTITLHNPNSAVANLTAPLTDALPTGVLVAGPASNTCGGSVAANIGGSTVTLTGGSIPGNGTCTISVPVTAKSPTCYANRLPAGALQTDKGSNADLFVALLTVDGTPSTKPSVIKGFAPTDIGPGGITKLIITLSNPTSTIAKLTAPFTDTFPSGMLVAGAASNTCGGTVTAPIGGSTVTLTGGSIPAHGSCTISVNVTARVDGSYYNKLSACSLHTDKGCNTGSYIAVLTVGTKLSKTFSPSVMNAGGVSLLTITLHNPDSTVASMTAPLTDTLPNGVVVAGTASNTCGGTVTAQIGGSTVTLTGGSIPAHGLCSVKVNVTARYPNCCYLNNLPIGALQTNKGGNTAPYSAILHVN